MCRYLTTNELICDQNEIVCTIILFNQISNLDKILCIFFVFIDMRIIFCKSKSKYMLDVCPCCQVDLVARNPCWLSGSRLSP